MSSTTWGKTMRKLVTLAAVLALAGCGQPDEDTVMDAEAMTEEVAEVDPVVGTYGWTEDDGTEVIGHLNADGTSGIEVDGEMVSESTWARNDTGEVCISWEAGVDEDGEEYEAGTDCMTFGEVGEDGSLEVIDAEGNVDTVTKLS